MKETTETPLIKQYFEIKQQNPEAMLLFRVGDFYESYGDDAVFTSKALNIVLTRKSNGNQTYIEMAGFPYHALDTYLHKLVQAGKKVAICEQLEDPKLTKKLVKRGVIELITPGISLNDKLLEGGRNNFLCGIFEGKDEPQNVLKRTGEPREKSVGRLGLAFLDISTGEFFVAEGNRDYARKLLDDFKPSEVIMPKTYRDTFFSVFGNRFYITVFDDWVFKPDFARETICKHFRVKSLKGFGIENMAEAPLAAAACLHYLLESKHENTSHISSIQKIMRDDYMWMDGFTLRNLEVLEPSSPAADASPDAKNSLYAVVNRTSTPMGSRLLRRYLTLPLRDKAQIENRLDHVEFLVAHTEEAEFLSTSFKVVGDLERLLSKVAALRVQPRELLQLRLALETVQKLKEHFEGQDSIAGRWAANLDACPELSQYIATWIHPEAPAVAAKGNVIAEGADAQLDELRKMAFSGKEYLADLLQRETVHSGITNLKLGFNNVYGYYLEVSKGQKDKVPQEWVRRQTLTTGERYITDELKTYEEKVLGAQQQIETLEATLYATVVNTCCQYINRVQKSVQAIAFMDVMNSFARVATDYHYVRPELVDGYDLDIVQGRHPVIEQHMESGQKYVPNDMRLHYDSCRIMMITGPNMSGKSAVLRQTALIVLLAQAGCFVPAESARIGLVDKLFTRVGASDNIASGESTFMVEMNETANILNNLSERSLVLLDEIGRGTSTYDGISIAWAIAEYLHEAPNKNCKVLFATHYHELNQMASQYAYIRNYHVKVKEVDEQVIFLRTLEEGGSEHSFGIHVAEMVGMPPYVVGRAKEILYTLESSRGSQDERGENFVFNGALGANMAEYSSDGDGREGVAGEKIDSREVEKGAGVGSNETQSAEKEKYKGYQLSFIQLDDPLLEKIRDEILDLDLNSLTPLQALNKLDEIKRLLKK